jgi:hypothetical protein
VTLDYTDLKENGDLAKTMARLLGETRAMRKTAEEMEKKLDDRRPAWIVMRNMLKAMTRSADTFLTAVRAVSDERDRKED